MTVYESALSICWVQSTTSPSGLRSIQAGQLELVSLALGLTVGSQFNMGSSPFQLSPILPSLVQWASQTCSSQVMPEACRVEWIRVMSLKVWDLNWWTVTGNSVVKTQAMWPFPTSIVQESISPSDGETQSHLLVRKDGGKDEDLKTVVFYHIDCSWWKTIFLALLPYLNKHCVVCRHI